jgi:hypothetical protein
MEWVPHRASLSRVVQQLIPWKQHLLSKQHPLHQWAQRRRNKSQQYAQL